MAKNYHLGPVKTHVKAAAAELGERFEYGTIYGWSAIGSVPDSDHPKGLALDLMTNDRDKGNATVEYLIANAQRLGIKYIIYWERIWHPDSGWEEYNGPRNHKDHVHVSFTAGGGSGGAPVDTGSAIGGPLNPANWPVVKQIEAFSSTLVSPAFWSRIGYYTLGMALLAFGLLVLFRKPVGQVATAAITKKVV